MFRTLIGNESAARKTFRFLKENFLTLLYAGKGMCQTINGSEFRILPKHRHVLAGVHDAAVAEFIKERIRPGDLCLNVGANVGLYALQFARWSGDGGRVIAFEPAPDSARDLRKHAEFNGYSETIRVVEKAVSDKPGQATFFVSGTEQMNRLGSPNPLLSATKAIHVEVTSLDAFCRDEKIDPAWVLIDVEGFEIAALKGAAELLRKRRDQSYFVVEMHPDTWAAAGTSQKELEMLLEELALQPVPLNGQKDCLTDYGMVWLKPA